MASCHLVKSSAKSVMCGASSYCEKVSFLPIYGKIFKFALCVLLTYRHITNSLEIIEKNFVYINTYIC
jgi:hypothetical protein